MNDSMTIYIEKAIYASMDDEIFQPVPGSATDVKASDRIFVINARGMAACEACRGCHG